ncbi:hypothetical protein [Natronogracilivirga saccharolytica]|uniref:Uncharacterized protein n=1 Tax=Natronogracilivirga saccharolytica TaxID=2812953 RepID=A0A8J7S479_9BACT|nr:hypothetical protein [Natronogracilivirga saccharolytica]MBP3191683.1 hypothetical protein [Natronogracilivirga saccharolytica]
MKVNISKSRDFIMVWAKGNVDLYLKPSGNYETAYHDLRDEDLRILKGLWNHLQSKKRNMEYAALEKGIEEVIKALDKIIEERKN